MTTKNLKDSYFFEIPLSDIYGLGCAALNLVYYGACRGSFCHDKKSPIDLGLIEAIQIVVAPRTVTLTTDEFEYNLVYFRSHLARDIWSGWKRLFSPGLRKETRRVKYTEKPSLVPHRLRHLCIPSHHPIYVAEFQHIVPVDDCVPAEYIAQFRNDFEGFLMCSHRGYDLESHLFASLGLRVKEARDPHRALPTAPHVVAYSKAEVTSASG